MVSREQGWASADLLGPVAETLPSAPQAMDLFGGDRKEYKMQACSLRCLFPKNAQKGALGTDCQWGIHCLLNLTLQKFQGQERQRKAEKIFQIKGILRNTTTE